jgi:outer membrane protein
MIKKILSAACLLLVLTSATAYGQLKIGYMNTQEVLSELPQRSEVEEQLNGFISSRRGELEDRIANFQDAVSTYQENQSDMSEQEIQQREQELSDQEAEMRKFQQNLQSQIQERRSKLLQPLYDAMDQAIADVAESKELDFVLNEATANGENLVYFSADEQLNITQQVINQVKANSE